MVCLMAVFFSFQSNGFFFLKKEDIIVIKSRISRMIMKLL